MDRRQKLIRGGIAISVFQVLAALYLATDVGPDVRHDMSPMETFLLMSLPFLAVIWAAIWFCLTFLAAFRAPESEDSE